MHINLPSVLGSLSMFNKCFVISKCAMLGLKVNALLASWAPGALLWELFEPRDDVDADSDSLLPFCK